MVEDRHPADDMPWKTLEWAYKLARSYVEWKDMMEQGVSYQDQIELAYRRLSNSEEMFRRQLHPTGAPCQECPDSHQH